MPGFSGRALLVLVAIILQPVGWLNAVHADEQRGRGERLYREAKALVDAGDCAHAIPILTESCRLEPRSTNFYELARCLDAEGRVASAHAAYQRVIELAQQEGRPDRVRAASELASALEPRMHTLAIDVPGDTADLPGLSVSLDGAPIRRGDWSKAIPLDPGTYVVQVSATGRVTWQRSVTLEGREAARAVILVPPLAVDDAGARPAAAGRASVLRSEAPPSEGSQVSWALSGGLGASTGVAEGIGAVPMFRIGVASSHPSRLAATLEVAMGGGQQQGRGFSEQRALLLVGRRFGATLGRLALFVDAEAGVGAIWQQAGAVDALAPAAALAPRLGASYPIGQRLSFALEGGLLIGVYRLDHQVTVSAWPTAFASITRSL